MISKTIRIPIYGGRWTIVFVESLKEVEEKYKISDTEGYDALTLSKGSWWCTAFMNSEITPGIVAHECKHLLNNLFRHVGMRLDVDNDEAECYLLGWMVDTVNDLREKHEIPYKLRKRSGPVVKRA